MNSKSPPPKVPRLYHSWAVANAAAWASVYEIDTLTFLMPAFLAAVWAAPWSCVKS